MVLRSATVAFVAALVASPAAWADPDPGMPTGPEDPRCATMPQAVQCQGSPYAPPVPTGPLDPHCMQMPADAACLGSPYVPQPPPPPPPPMPPPMPMPMPPMTGMPGMPGHI